MSSPFRPLILAKCQELFDITDADRHLRSLNVHIVNRKLHNHTEPYEQSITSFVYGTKGLYNQKITEQSHSCDCPDRADICKHIIKLSVEVLIKHEELSNES